MSSTVEPKVKVYDFTRPDKFSKDQTRVVQMLHESYAALSSSRLSQYLRCEVGVRVASVDQLTYEEFVAAIPDPTVIAAIGMDPLRGDAVLEIDPAVSYAMLDRLFGGVGADQGLRRPITPTECAVLEEFLPRTLADLGEAWSMVVDLKPRLGSIETRPQFLQIVPPTEMVILVTLETRIGAAKGMMNLCIPYLTLETVVPRLSQKLYYSSIRASKPSPAPDLGGLAVDLEVSYEGERQTLAGLRRLRKGSRVGVEGYAEGRAYLRAGSAPLYHLQAGRGTLRRTGRPSRGRVSTYTLVDRESATDLGLLSGRGPAEQSGGALEPALKAMSAQLVGTLKTLETRVAELARRQGELQDQLLFQPSEKAETVGAQPLPSFAFLSRAHCDALAAFLASEHPQLVALLLSRVETGLAVCLLDHVSPGERADIVQRLAGMAPVPPEILAVIERVLQKQVAPPGAADYAASGGVDTVAQLLGVAPRALERGVIEALETRDPELAEKIKRRVFVFEDIVLLEDAHLAAVLREVADDDLVFALKATEDVVAAKVRTCLGDRAASLGAALGATGAVRLVDADAAQQRIVAVVRRLEDAGRIVIPRAGEPLVG